MFDVWVGKSEELWLLSARWLLQDNVGKINSGDGEVYVGGADF
jgi:hypothetical protein